RILIWCVGNRENAHERQRSAPRRPERSVLRSHVAYPGKREPYRRSASFAAGPRTRWHVPNSWIPRSLPPHVCDEFMTIIAIDGFRSRFLQCNESGSERK